MNIISVSDLRRLGMDKTKEIMPVLVMSEGEVFGLLSDPDETISLQGMNVFMKRSLRDRAHIARGLQPDTLVRAIHKVREAKKAPIEE